MENRGNAVCYRLPVAVEERDVHGEAHARPRHHLPLEGVAMDVDDAGQHQQARGIEAPPRRGLVADVDNQTICGRKIEACVFQTIADERASSLDA